MKFIPVLAFIIFTVQVYTIKQHLIQHQFIKINIYCLPNFVIKGISERSHIQCASNCLSLSTPNCKAFTWNEIYKTCTTMVNIVNNDEVDVPMQAEFEIYNAFKDGCSDKGYYYDLPSDTCLKMFVDSHGKTWEDARNHCQRDGGDLISMTTMAKWNFVTHFTSCMSNLWIGLKEERWVTDDIFEYLFNVTVQLDRYDHDFENDPDQSCGKFIPNVGVYDESCNIRERQSYVCEILV